MADLLAAVAGQLPERRKHGARVAALAESLFALTKHLHGLTKSSLKLLRVAAVLRQLSPCPDGSRAAIAGELLQSADNRLTADQRTILMQVVDLVPPTRGRAAYAVLNGRSKKQVLAAVAMRLAAVLHVAESIAERCGRNARIVGINDSGRGIEIYVDNGVAKTAKARRVPAEVGLWNRIAMRPIEAVVLRPAAAAPIASLAGQSVPEVGRRIMLRYLEQLLSRQYGLHYPEDVEYVHEMRVATRRIRAARRIFRKAYRGELAAEAKAFKKLGDLLGVARDGDVFLEFLERYRQAQGRSRRPLLDGLIQAEKRALRRHYGRLRTWCQAAAHQRLVREFYARLRRPAGARGGLAVAAWGREEPVTQRARKSVRRLVRQATAFGERLEALSNDQQHELRIVCKTLRYTAEFFAPHYPRVLDDLIARATRMQDLLGNIHDAEVYYRRLQSYFRKRGRNRAGGPAATLLKAVRAHLRRRSRICANEAAVLWKVFTGSRFQAKIERLIRMSQD